MPRGSGLRGGRFHGAQPRRICRFVEPALLLMLHARPTHGYGLLDGLSRLGLDSYPADSSTIYRMLRSLEQAGMILSNWDAEETAGPPRRMYQLTETGSAYLKAWVEDLRATDQVHRKFLKAYEEHVAEGEGLFREGVVQTAEAGQVTTERQGRS